VVIVGAASGGADGATDSPERGTAESTAPCTSWPSCNYAIPPKAAPTSTPRKRPGKPRSDARTQRRLFNVVYASMVTDQKRREAASPGGTRGRLFNPA
jgi:hypothetical protein